MLSQREKQAKRLLLRLLIESEGECYHPTTRRLSLPESVADHFARFNSGLKTAKSRQFVGALAGTSPQSGSSPSFPQTTRTAERQTVSPDAPV